MKKERLIEVKRIIKEQEICNQEDLQNILREKGFEVTQATLSRDIKQLKIVKSPNEKGDYVYILPQENIYTTKMQKEEQPHYGIASVEFSGQLAVLKTRPGYASGIASDIDNQVSYEILGTIAGDDTVLIIPREGVTREEVLKFLSEIVLLK